MRAEIQDYHERLMRTFMLLQQLHAYHFFKGSLQYNFY